MEKNKDKNLKFIKAYRIGKLIIEQIDMVKDIIYTICFYHIGNQIIIIQWFSIIMPFFITLGTTAKFHIPHGTFDHILIYFGMDIFFQCRHHYQPINKKINNVYIAVFGNMIQFLNFYADTLAVGDRWTVYQMYFPLLSYVLYCKTMGEVTGIATKTANHRGYFQGSTYFLVCICIISLIVGSIAEITIFYHYFVVEQKSLAQYGFMIEEVEKNKVEDSVQFRIYFGLFLFAVITLYGAFEYRKAQDAKEEAKHRWAVIVEKTNQLEINQNYRRRLTV